jgi:hypothetical protein
MRNRSKDQIGCIFFAILAVALAINGLLGDGCGPEWDGRTNTEVCE